MLKMNSCLSFHESKVLVKLFCATIANDFAIDVLQLTITHLKN